MWLFCRSWGKDVISYFFVSCCRSFLKQLCLSLFLSSPFSSFLSFSLPLIFSFARLFSRLLSVFLLQAAALTAKQAELQRIVEQLEEKIEGFKKQYAICISQAEAIKSEMAVVQKKVERSVALLGNLTSERQRWEQESNGFQTQMSTLIGDCLLSAAFLTYSGFFNVNYRAMLYQKWTDRCHDVRIKFKSDLSLIEYLSLPNDRLEWQANSLPADDLCTENAIILSRFNRYPLIIDPSGQATTFLMKQYQNHKILRTSFMDEAFVKNLESALRFGNALLVCFLPSPCLLFPLPGLPFSALCHVCLVVLACR